MTQPKDFGFREDETLLRDSVRKFLSDNAAVDRVRQVVARDHDEAYQSDIQPAAYDDNLWKQMIELGWTSLAVPENAGGAGMKMVAVAALAEEAGRAALVSPLIATMSATCVLREADSDAAKSWLEKIVGGEAATLAITDENGSWEPGDTSITAEPQNGSTVLSGTVHFVQDARKVSFFAVSARGDGGVGIYAVPADAPGLTIHPDQIVDLTRDQARVELRDVLVPSSNVVAAPGKGEEALARAMPALLTIVSADLCGAGEWQLQTTVEYAKVRTQFDRPLGFFQAVKHPLVNMMIEIDRAKSLVYNAACAIDSEPAVAERAARMAKSAASDMAAFCCGRSVQLHGGIGFTWECDVHIYFKRQKHNQMLYGDAAYQRTKLAEVLGA
jgi:alkylation response protein AidB-like acyl-CoA dehydrogenase